jgi:hypothetical protein
MRGDEKKGGFSFNDREALLEGSSHREMGKSGAPLIKAKMNIEDSLAAKHLPKRLSSKCFGLLTFAGLELWIWFDMADLDYKRGILFPFTTAIWFIFGQVFAIPIFGLLIWVMTLFFKRWPKAIGALVVGSVACLLGIALHRALPQQRLNRLIGPELIQNAEIESLRVTNSFGDGVAYDGILLLGPEFLIALEANPSFALVKPHPGESVPPEEAGSIYRSKRATLRILPDGSRCIFERFVPYAPPKTQQATP